MSAAQLTMEQLQQAYGGINLSNLNQSEYNSYIDLARGAGTQSYSKFCSYNPTKRIVIKSADFKSEEESARIKQEADYGVPLINREKFTQKIIDYKVSKNTYSAIYEYIEGEDLLQYRDKRNAENKPINYQEAADIALEIYSILIPLHARNVGHRNLKLANVIKRKSDGKLILGDFSFGATLIGKMYFGVQFTDKMALHNVCLDPDLVNDSTQSPRLDANSLVMLFCQLLNKKLNLGQFSKINPTNFIKMEDCIPPVPDFVAESIKYLSIGDTFGNRQPLTEIIRIFSQWATKAIPLQQKVLFHINEEVQQSAALDMDYKYVTMVYPCSRITDEQFYNYMQALSNKKKQPYEKIKLHFGGNLITQSSLSSMIEAFTNLNTSKLRSLTINLNYNNLTNIFNLIKQIENFELPCLEKLTLGFNSCQITVENIELLIDTLLKKNFQNLKKLFIDLRGNCQESQIILDSEVSLKQQQKQRINSRDPQKRQRYIVKFSKNIIS